MARNKRTADEASLNTTQNLDFDDESSVDPQDPEGIALAFFQHDEEGMKDPKVLKAIKKYNRLQEEEKAKQGRINALNEMLESGEFQTYASPQYKMIKDHIQALNDLEDDDQVRVLKIVFTMFQGVDIEAVHDLLLNTDFLPKNKAMAYALFSYFEFVPFYTKKINFDKFVEKLQPIFTKHKNVFDRMVSDRFSLFDSLCENDSPLKFYHTFYMYKVLLRCDIRFLDFLDKDFFLGAFHDDLTKEKACFRAFVPDGRDQYMFLAKGFALPDLQNLRLALDCGDQCQIHIDSEGVKLANSAKKLDAKARMLFEMFADNRYVHPMANACQCGPLRGEANARLHALFSDLPEHIAVPFSLNTHSCFDILMNRIAQELYPNAKDWEEAAELHKKVRNQKYFEEVASEVTNTVFSLSPAAAIWRALPPICNRDNVSIWISTTLLSNSDRIPYVPSGLAFDIAKNIIGALKECAKTKNGREQLFITNAIYNAMDSFAQGCER
jgi:hypothetical protein